MSEKPPTEDELSTLDDAQLRRIAYGRGDGPHGTGGLSREAAAQEIARRTPPRAEPAPPASNTARPLTAPQPSIDDLDALDDDGVPRPFWTRARLVGAAVLAASIAVGTAIGFGIDRVADALAPDSLAIFDRPATDDELRAAEAGLRSFGGEVIVERRLLATVGEIRIYGDLLPADSGFVRSDVGEQVCIGGEAPDEFFYGPQCVPRDVFASQGIAGALYEVSVDGSALSPDAMRTIWVTWGPRGDAAATLNSPGVMP